MFKIRFFINRLSRTQKITSLFLVICFVLFVTVAIPTLSRYKHRTTVVPSDVWDGSVADSYKSGSGGANDPYVISSGNQLAYLSEQLLSDSYNDTYFVLANDIILNEGVFKYDASGKILYILNDVTYYIDYYTNKYYDNPDMLGEEIGTVNVLNSLSNFKGNFDGSSYRILGLYITSETNDEVALFTNLEGNVHDLYVENAMVYGGVITGGISARAINSEFSNILFDGYVVGRNGELVKNVDIDISDSIINVTNTSNDDSISLENNVYFVGSNILSSSFSGSYVVNAPEGAYVSIKINNIDVSDGLFNIPLGTNAANSITITTYTDSVEPVTVNLLNLKYSISYDYAISGGIAAFSSNSHILNSINKGEIHGYSVAGGLVGLSTTSTNIEQSYNTGNVTSQYVSGGLIGTIEKSSSPIIISKSYNTGDMSASIIGGLIGSVENNSNSVSLNNVFNTSSTDFSIGKISNTVLNVSNAYYVNGDIAVGEGIINNGELLTAVIDDLRSKSYVIDNLEFNEFVNSNDLLENEENVWLYSKNSLPILFIDDIAKPIAILHAGNRSWDNFTEELDMFSFDNTIAFSIEAADEFEPIKEKYYYIANSSQILTKLDLDQVSTWVPYTGIVQLNSEGAHIVYLKIVDFDNNVTYINSDVLTLDLVGPSVNISAGESTWSLFKSELDYRYINSSIEIAVLANDNISEVTSLKYYSSSFVMTIEELKDLDDSSWVNYSIPIVIDSAGKYIIYVKAVDSVGHVSYANTDFIVLGGYTEESITIGRKSNSYSLYDPYITNKSIVTLNFKYQNTNAEQLTDITHNLLSSVLLPLGTKITLIDNVNYVVYEYKINTNDDIFNYNNSCELGDLNCQNVATYPFSLFKEVGIAGVDKYFEENDYNVDGVINEDFSVVLDFSSTNINVNYENILIYMELHNELGNNIRQTMVDTLKHFNVYSVIEGDSTAAVLSLETDYNGSSIVLDSDSSIDINLNSKIDYKKINDKSIIDTYYEDRVIGLSIKLVDENNNIIDRNNYKNVSFKLGDALYYPGYDNITRINFQTGVIDTIKSLTIITKEDNNILLNAGNYYFKISSYVSEDGYYYDSLGDNEISIPVVIVSGSSNILYGFDVNMNDSNRIISKADESTEVSFKILQNGYNLLNPNIRVSLYKKDLPTAYDQNYSLVDLSLYVSDSLNLVNNKVYYASTYPIQYDGTENTYNYFNLNLITANFENTGYKFVFDLYDDTRKVGTIEKYFIVK